MSEQLTIPNLSSMTWEQFYESCKPEGIMLQYHRVNNPTDSVSLQRVSLQNITFAYHKVKHDAYGECTPGVLYLYEWLDYLNSVSNINKPLPAKSMQQLAIILYSKYYLFYFSDLKLVLEGILEGEYGKFYGSVDSQLIMRAFAEYSKKRQQAIYELRQRNQQ